MRFSLFLAGVALFAATAVSAKHDEIHARAVAAPAGPAFPELQARVEHTADGALQIRGGPSGTTTAESANHVKRGGRTIGRQLGVRVKAKRVLKSCSGGISVSVTKIKQHCGGANKGNITVVIKLLLAELYVILALCKQCLKDIKGCPGGPLPSQPPTNPPTPWELCQCIIEIIILLQGCFTQLIVLCGKFSVARNACAGVLIEISACLCEILRSCDGVLDFNVIALLKLNAFSVFAGIKGIDFGFSALAKVVI
jgi:hypothetical protein